MYVFLLIMLAHLLGLEYDRRILGLWAVAASIQNMFLTYLIEWTHFKISFKDSWFYPSCLFEIQLIKTLRYVYNHIPFVNPFFDSNIIYQTIQIFWSKASLSGKPMYFYHMQYLSRLVDISSYITCETGLTVTKLQISPNNFLFRSFKIRKIHFFVLWVLFANYSFYF